MPAELACGALENYPGRFHRQRWHRIRLRTRRIKGAGAREAGNADLPLDFGVVGLEVGVRDRPIGEAGAYNRTDLAALDEIDFMEAPEIRGEVDAGATDASAVYQRALRLGFVIRRLAECGWLKLWMVGELVLTEDFNFVVREIRFGQVGALLQNDNAETVGGKFLGEDSAGRAGADNDEIHFVGSLVFGLVDHHFLSASFAAGCQPG